MKALCIDLFCGLGGWTEGFLAEGYEVVGFDIERHQYGEHKYPGQLVIQDVLTLHGSQFKDATILVASPPCQNYSYLAMPWSRSKDPNNSKAAKALRLKWETEGPDNRLFDACFRIQREAIEATRDTCKHCAGSGRFANGNKCYCCDGRGWRTERHIPLIVENTRGAIPWVGRSAWNYGSFHLWGDVPALMPVRFKAREKGNGGSWFFRTGDDTAGDPRDVRRGSDGQYAMPEGTKQSAGNGDWFSKEARDGGASARFSSRSKARKAASAQIAKIPRPLSEHIARVYKPRTAERVA